ncbi:MAG: L,D-transpeptidase family protein [Pseudomonadota bacterium]
MRATGIIFQGWRRLLKNGYKRGAEGENSIQVSNMHFIRAGLLALTALLVMPASAQVKEDPVAAQILRLASAPRWGGLSSESMELLRRLYAPRQGAPLWVRTGDGRKRAAMAQHLLANAYQEGLRPADYAVALTPPPPEDAEAQGLAEADLSLSAGMLRYISDVHNGRRNPTEIDPELQLVSERRDPVDLLRKGMEAEDFKAWLKGLHPSTHGYVQLRDALARMRSLAQSGPWPLLPDGPKLEKGSRGPAIPIVRSQLVKFGDRRAGMPEDHADEFDAALEAAVRAFQERHGLEPDGIVGRRTRGALNTSPSERVRQIILNMERLRWLKEDFGPHFVLVNIASFELIAIAGNAVALRSPVIVGREYRRTPVFSDHIVNLVLSPTWTPPPRLARLDVLPKIKADPAYLAQQGFRVFDGWGPESRELNPDGIDWRGITADNLRYRLRQEPGPRNALGGVRFSLTNAFGIYLHDTPHRELFSKTARGFSSGCIRVAKALELALFALENDPAWPPGRLSQAMTSARTQVVRLARPLPVHIIYHTAWVDEAGVLQFREDIYGRDVLLRAALKLDAPPVR